MYKSLKQLTFLNISYNIVAKIVMFVFQGAANIVLSRNLGASDYGIVGFAMIFVNFLLNFSDMGLNSAAIQRKNLSEKELYVAFTLKSILGIFAFITIVVLSEVAHLFFDNPAIVTVLKLLSVNFIIYSFAFIPRVLLTRQLDYKTIAMVEAGHVSVNSIVAIVLALSGMSYWSIVMANIASTFLYVIGINALKPHKIKVYFEWNVAKDFLSYGKNIFLSGVVVFTIFNIDNFAIGYIEGSSMLGYYAIAFNWGSMICTILSSVVLSVLFPTFTLMQSDVAKIKQSYLKIMEYISFIGVLANLVLLTISREFLIYILGKGTDKWLPALPALRILCVYGLIRVLLEPIGQVVMAMGKTGIILKSTIIVALIEIGLLYPALRYFSIGGVAVVITAAYATQYLIYFPYLRKNLNLTLKEVWISVLPALCSSLALLLIFILYEYYSSVGISTLIQKIGLCLTSYVLVYTIATKGKIMKEVKILIKSTMEMTNVCER